LLKGRPFSESHRLPIRPESKGVKTREEIHKEGFRNLEDVKQAWTMIYGTWQPDQTVWVYEFRLVKSEKEEDDPTKQHERRMKREDDEERLHPHNRAERSPRKA